MSHELLLDWTLFKATAITGKGLLVQFTSSSDAYDVFAIDALVVYKSRVLITVPPNADETDFVTNYLPTANRFIFAETNTSKELLVHDQDVKDDLDQLTFSGPNLLVTIAGGSSEQHTVDAPGDLYIPGTTKGTVADVRVVSAYPTPTAGQFSALSVLNSSGELIVHDKDVKAAVENIAITIITNANLAPRLYLANSGRILTGTGDATFNTTDTAMLLLKNPALSGKNLKLYFRSYNVDITNVACRFRLFLNPTITADGTAITIRPATQTLNPATVATAFTNPTVTALGTLLDTNVIGQNNSGFTLLDELALWLQPGNNWLVGATSASNSRPVEIVMKWVEELI